MDDETKLTEIEQKQPEEFKRILDFFREVRDVTDDIFEEISITLMQDEEFKKLCYDPHQKSEEYMLNLIDKVIIQFVCMIPLAMSNGVNPVMSMLTAHSTITGHPLMTQIVEKLNKEKLEGQ